MACATQRARLRSTGTIASAPGAIPTMGANRPSSPIFGRSGVVRAAAPPRRSAVLRLGSSAGISRLTRDPAGFAAMLRARTLQSAFAERASGLDHLMQSPAVGVGSTGRSALAVASPSLVSARSSNRLSEECLTLPLTVSSCDVSDLRNVCAIDLGLHPLMNGIPGRDVNHANSNLIPEGRLLATVPLDFEPTSSHNEFLSVMLPRWWNKIGDFDEDVWQISSDVFMASALPRKEWLNRGLYWQTDDGFLFRAVRYAIATLYAWAFTCESIGVFQKGCKIDKDWIRSEMRNGWRVDLGDMCSYDRDLIRVEGMGGLAVRRTWRGAYTGITPMGASTLNDEVQLNAALADYHFWWAHRLYDQIAAGKSTNTFADLWVCMCCARAGLAEIAEISALLMHEISHWAGWRFTLAECSGLDLGGTGKLECCHFQMGWFHGFRVTADCGLPLSMFPNLGQDQFDTTGRVVEYANRGSAVFPTDNLGNQRERFDFDLHETWNYLADCDGPTDCGATTSLPSGSFMACAQGEPWSLDHSLTVSWDYPSECAAAATAGSQSFNG